MAESNVPITRISNIKMLVAFARNGNKFKKTNNKKQQRNKKQKTKGTVEKRRGRQTERERGGEKPLQIATSTQSQSKLFSKLIFMSCQK